MKALWNSIVRGCLAIKKIKLCPFPGRLAMEEKVCDGQIKLPTRIPQGKEGGQRTFTDIAVIYFMGLAAERLSWFPEKPREATQTSFSHPTRL